MMAGLQRDAGGVNRFPHNREPAAIDKQTVIRMNRDTLYSFAVVDISEGATLTVPDAGDRYLSVMVVNEDHYINRVFHDPGRYELTVEDFGSPTSSSRRAPWSTPRTPTTSRPWPPSRTSRLEATSGRPFELPDYDTDEPRPHPQRAAGLAADLTTFRGMFGATDDVDPVHHLIGTAAGWGGLPDAEATYVGVSPNLPVGEYELTVGDDAGRRLLVDLGLQRRGLLRAQRAGRLQRQQHHRRPQRRRHRHGPLRWLPATTPCPSPTAGTTSSVSTGRAPRS